jgi:hypothetical protein
MRQVRKDAARRAEAGQALAEMGIVVTVLVFLALGIIEFGRAWMIANVVITAARDGARAASTLPLADRFQSGGLAGQIDPSTQDWLDIRQQVQAVIASVYSDGTPPQVTLDPDVDPTSAIKMISVTVVEDVSWLFLGSMLGQSRFHIARSITFRDEGR